MSPDVNIPQKKEVFIQILFKECSNTPTQEHMRPTLRHDRWAIAIIVAFCPSQSHCRSPGLSSHILLDPWPFPQARGSHVHSAAVSRLRGLRADNEITRASRWPFLCPRPRKGHTAHNTEFLDCRWFHLHCLQRFRARFSLSPRSPPPPPPTKLLLSRRFLS